MTELREFLPFLLPLFVVQVGLLVYTLHHILTHNRYRRGTRTLWLAVTIILCNFVGPILYLLLGREDA